MLCVLNIRVQGTCNHLEGTWPSINHDWSLQMDVCLRPRWIGLNTVVDPDCIDLSRQPHRKLMRSHSTPFSIFDKGL